MLKLRTIALSAALLLAACADMPGGRVDPPADFPRFGAFLKDSAPQSKTITITVTIAEPDQVRKLCAAIYGDTWPAKFGAPSCMIRAKDGAPARIIVDRPTSWDDLTPIMHLGHEVLHELGAEHK